MIVTINIPSQLPALTGNANLFLRVNAGENGIEWAATAGGGITIGTTAIASGAVGRVLFEGAGNVVQQDSTFVWNNTDKRLILGADQASVDTNPRLVVVGKNPSGTTTLAAFHNSTGNSNALVVRDNGNVAINGNTFISNSPLTVNLPNAANNYLTINQANNVVSGLQLISWGRTHQIQGGNQRLTIQGGTLSDIYIQSGTSPVGTGITVRPNTGKVGINSTVHASARFQIDSTTEGFLPPRMTTTERNAITTPATGLTIFNTDNNTINQRTSSAWVDLVSSSNYDGLNIAFGTTNGTKIGTATTQKISFWNATPIVQPTTAVAAAAFVANTSLIANDTATFDGYTIGQIVKALRNTGILA
jgi:hypothetical protein